MFQQSILPKVSRTAAGHARACGRRQRRVWRAGAGVLAMVLMCAQAAGQDKVSGYPARPVRIVVGTTPGGALDALARLIAQRFNAHYGQNAIVDNRPGAGTQLGMDVVAAAQPDGHTLLCASETVLLLGAQKRTRYDVLKTFTPVSWLTTTAYVLIVNPAVPAAHVKEFIAYAKTRPGEVRYGTPGVGATQHLIWERFGQLTGVQFAHVPYKAGALATLDVVSGQIQATMTTVGNAIGPIKSNRVRPLAVTGLKRLQAMPELPSIAESALPGFEAVSYYSLYAPSAVLPAIITSLNAVMAQAMQSTEAQRAVSADGAEIAPAMTPKELRAKFERDFVEMEKAVRGAKILQ